MVLISKTYYQTFVNAYKNKYGTDWDWTKSVIGWHGYGTVPQISIKTIMAAWPCWCTETELGTYSYIEKCELERDAWVYMDGKQSWNSSAFECYFTGKNMAWWLAPVVRTLPGRAALEGIHLGSAMTGYHDLLGREIAARHVGLQPAAQMLTAVRPAAGSLRLDHKRDRRAKQP